MAAKKAAPAEEKVEEVPDKEQFTYEPKDGSPTIHLPLAKEAIPRGKAIGFFYKLNKLKESMIDQVVFVLNSAGVEESVADRVFDLDDEEIKNLVTAWTHTLGGATPGE